MAADEADNFSHVPQLSFVQFFWLGVQYCDNCASRGVANGLSVSRNSPANGLAFFARKPSLKLGGAHIDEFAEGSCVLASHALTRSANSTTSASTGALPRNGRDSASRISA